MKYLHLFLPLLALLLGVSCSGEDDLTPNAATRQTRISLRLSGEEPTRGGLDSNDVTLNSISTVYLYIFEGETADAPCILKHDIGWQADDASREYWTSHPLKPNTAYTYLAAGWDTASGGVYSLPDAVDVGTPLGKAVARLADKNGKAQMAAAEIYAGQCVKAVRPDQASVKVDICLRRKMAGVLAYFESVPYRVGDKVVDKVKVRLHTAQNTSMPLWKEDPRSEVFGSAPLPHDDGTLMEWDMSGYTHNDDIYTSPVRTDASGQPVQLENTLLSGVFLLPVARSSEATLRIELCDAADTVLKVFDVRHLNRLQFDLRENCFYSMGTKLSSHSTEGDRPIPLSGNHIDIHVAPWTDIDSNQSFESIQGAARILSHINSEKYIFDATCNRFDLFIKKGNPQKQWLLSVVYKPYVDAQGITHPTGNPTFANAPHDDLRDWIHIADTDAEGNITGYANQRLQTDGSSQVVTIVLNDYAVQRNLTDGVGATDAPDNARCITDPAVAALFADDYRTAYLKIETVGSTPLYYRIRQYNALTFHTDYTGDASEAEAFNPDPNPYRAASRLDFGWKFNETTGQPEMELTPSSDICWGMQQSATVAYADFNTSVIKSYMSVDDGQMNARAMMRKCEGNTHENIRNGYAGCAVKRVGTLVTEIRTLAPDRVEDLNTGHHIDRQYWYLPAANEMLGIVKNFTPTEGGRAALALYGMVADTPYWTSTDHESNMFKAHYVTATAQSPLMSDKKDTPKRTRRVRHFGKVN